MTRAFTLVELLVVITIIVLVLALIVPAMEKAIDHAERVRCAANLDAWGIAVVGMEARRTDVGWVTGARGPDPNGPINFYRGASHDARVHDR